LANKKSHENGLASRVITYTCHNHTQCSLLDGLTKVPALVNTISKPSGMEAVAMTDHGTLSGAIEFYKAAKAEGIKPIMAWKPTGRPHSVRQEPGQR